MKPTQQLHDLGRSLWLDNITRESCGTMLGIAIAQRTYKAYRQLLDSKPVAAAGECRRQATATALGQHGHKEPGLFRRSLHQNARRAVYRHHIPDKTLLAFADHGSVGELMEADGGDAEEMIAKFAKAGIDCDRLATDLQLEAAGLFVMDWN